MRASKIIRDRLRWFLFCLPWRSCIGSRDWKSQDKLCARGFNFWTSKIKFLLLVFLLSSTLDFHFCLLAFMSKSHRLSGFNFQQSRTEQLFEHKIAKNRHNDKLIIHSLIHSANSPICRKIAMLKKYITTNSIYKSRISCKYLLRFDGKYYRHGYIFFPRVYPCF